MVRIAWRDLGNAATVQQTLRELTVLADTIIDQALACLDRFQRLKRGVPCDECGVEQQLVVFALGKLGNLFGELIAHPISAVFVTPLVLPGEDFLREIILPGA